MADTKNLPAQLRDRNYTLIYAPTQLHRLGMTPGFEQRWQQAHDPILGLADQCHRLAVNGLTVYQWGDNPGGFQVHQDVNRANLESLMATAPRSEQLALAPVLETVLNRYFVEKATGQQTKNGEIIIILIDNEPTDRLAIAKLIVAASQKVDHHDELGIGWLQVGNDYITKGFLVTLDDNLRQKGAKFDIVDHKPIQQLLPNEFTNFLLDVLRD